MYLSYVVSRRNNGGIYFSQFYYGIVYFILALHLYDRKYVRKNLQLYGQSYFDIIIGSMTDESKERTEVYVSLR